MLDYLERASIWPWRMIRDLCKLWRHDRRATFPIPLRTRLAMWRRGFVSECQLVYQLDRNPISDYLPEYHRAIRTSRINRMPEALHHKLLFEAFFKALLPVPRSLAWISGGKLAPLTPDPCIQSPRSLLEACRRHGRLVIKPFGESGGRGFHLLSWEEDRWLLDGSTLTEESLHELLRRADNSIVTEFAEQGEYAARIFPRATNTLRVLVMRDPFRERQGFIPIAVHRFGTRSSAPVDNFQQGGLSAEVEVSTGILKKAVAYPRTGRLEWFSRHPDTGAPIEGVQVPGWSRITESLTKATEAYDFLDYVGWDVVAREDGFAVLEGNNHSGVVLLQVHRGLLADERARAFFRHHRVIRPRKSAT